MGARVSKKPQTAKTSQAVWGNLHYGNSIPVFGLLHQPDPDNACCARGFGLLRNSSLSSIHIHFGVVLLVLTALVTSVSLSKNSFLTDCQRSLKPSRQSTRPRSVCGYSRGSSCEVSQNTLRSKLFYDFAPSGTLLAAFPTIERTANHQNLCFDD